MSSPCGVHLRAVATFPLLMPPPALLSAAPLSAHRMRLSAHHPARHPVWTVRDRPTFQALRRSSIRVRRGRFTVSWVPGDPGDPPRVGYSVGRQVGGAVDRNLVRRRLRAVVREAAPSMIAGSYLVTAGAGARQVRFPALRLDVTTALAGVVEAAARRTPGPGEARG